MQASTDESDSSLKWAARDVEPATTFVEGEDDNFDIGEDVTILSGGAASDNLQGTLSYATPSGDVVSLTFQAEEGTDVLGGPGASQCLFSGQALGGP